MSDDSSINAAIALLQGQGFIISRPEWGPWTTPGDLQARFSHLSTGAFFKRLHAFPGEMFTKTGPTGRILRLRTSPELEKWLKRPLEQGKRRS